MTIIADSLQAIQANIIAAEHSAGRINHTLLLAVSKAQTADKMRSAYLAGQRAFGENYVQEAITKQASLSDLAIDWHFIGPIQSNKTALIAQHFDWVHSVDRLKIALRLNEARGQNVAPLNVCIQINSSDEISKSGVDIESLAVLALAISHMPQLKLRGIMAIPAPTKDLAIQHAQFKIVADVYKTLKQKFELDTLSIGMSDDYVVAIAEGATIVRIGSALFGARI
ncbi:MAG: YggS family pyridoxal phosphate-dependent enzyme [Bdellovibrio sp.]|nr:YggS family pyridoxal phosphate-dependent enzyme [Methylotenera sp.]